MAQSAGTMTKIRRDAHKGLRSLSSATRTIRNCAPAPRTRYICERVYICKCTAAAPAAAEDQVYSELIFSPRRKHHATPYNTCEYMYSYIAFATRRSVTDKSRLHYCQFVYTRGINASYTRGLSRVFISALVNGIAAECIRAELFFIF